MRFEGTELSYHTRTADLVQRTWDPYENEGQFEGH